MAQIKFVSKHNMIACVEKNDRNTEFHQIINFIMGCSVNYSLLVSPDLIQTWLQQFWTTAEEHKIDDVVYVRAKVAGKKVLISEASIREDLQFNDEEGVNFFADEVIWENMRAMGYEGSLTQLSFHKALFSPQWKYLFHILIHCLSPKSTSWDQRELG